MIPEPYHSKIVTSIVEPDCDGYDFQHMHDYFYNNGIIIYPGKLDGRSTFRIANMGDITYKDIETFLELLDRYLTRLGFEGRRMDANEFNDN
jgi:2-aminoethylphosphonate-pyruvate transaminase